MVEPPRVLCELRTACLYDVWANGNMRRVTKIQRIGGKCVVCVFGGRNLSLMVETADLTVRFLSITRVTRDVGGLKSF